VKARLVLGVLLVAAAIAATPSSAAAASCPVTPGVFTTTWIGGSGHYNTDANWSNGAPSGSCDASIVAPGSYTVTMNAGSNAKSMTIGGAGSTPTLQISAENANTNLLVTTSALTIAAGAGITLLCNVPPESCGAPNLSAPSISNAGTITVDASVDGMPFISGALTNTGTIQFNHAAKFDNGAVTNQGVFNIANGVTGFSGGSSCGDTAVSFKNDTGGTLNAAGTGTFDVINYEQGAGSTSGTSPVQIPCGSLKYTGNGTSSVLAYGGFNLTGSIQANQALTVTNNSSNTNASLGGNLTNNGTITLTCPTSSCSGPGFNIGANTFTNAGTFTVAAPVTTAGSVSGKLTNTGTMQFNGTARFDNAAVTNQGAFNVANGVTVVSSGSSCGDTGVSLKNDTGGTINATGTGTLSVVNYEQGAGSTSGTLPVQMPCGSLKYTGSGASVVQANGGFNLTGTMQAGQSLIVSAASSNTNATLQGNFVNKGSIALTCPGGGCSGGPGGGAGFNANGNTFTNEGTFTIAAASGTGAGTSGGLTNKGTIQFDQSGGLGGVILNQGVISIANEKTASLGSESCGNGTPRVINDTGGQIKSVGSGTLSTVNFEQGAGTTSGPTPVSMNCGTLKYVGSGASTIAVPNSVSLVGNLAAGQTLRVLGTLHTSGFTNAGTLVLDQSASNPNVNTGGTVVNTGTVTTGGASANAASIGGTLEQTGASAQTTVAAGTKLNLGNTMLLKAGKLVGTGSLGGSVNNSGGAVALGASPGTLSLTGSYTQGAGGSLQVEIDGTGAGQFDKLAVGGNATLGGTLALLPSSAFASASSLGDSVAFLAYGGSRTGTFATTTVSQAFACPRQLTAAYDDAGKKASATVTSTGQVCNEPPPPPPPPAAPDTKLGKHPKAKVKTTKSKVKVSFAFSSDVAGATFQCKLDKAAYGSCKSPRSYKVRPGKHTFAVRALGPGGTDASPASFSFKVVREKPKG